MRSETAITPLDAYLAVNNLVVMRVRPWDYDSEVDGLAPDKTNSIFDDGPSDCQIVIVDKYEIASPLEHNIVITSNNEQILATRSKSHTWGEAVVVRPQKKFQIEESHEHAITHLRVIIKGRVYDIGAPGGGT